jgi:hypothetical protein
MTEGEEILDVNEIRKMKPNCRKRKERGKKEKSGQGDEEEEN